jgi:hypothetical protein
MIKGYDRKISEITADFGKENTEKSVDLIERKQSAFVRAN